MRPVGYVGAVRLHVSLIILCLVATCSALVGSGHTLVYPRVLESRSNDGRKVLKVRDDLVLNLEPSTVFSDVFMIQTFHNGKPHESYHDAQEFHSELYQDPNRMASVMLTETDDVQVEGVLGHGLRIKPAPEAERSLDGQVAHMVYQVQERVHSDHSDYATMPLKSHFSDDHLSPDHLDIGDTVAERTDLYSKTFYPEAHLVVQYDHAKAFNFNHTAISRYFAVFMNVVNLRYKSVPSPKVRVRIAGLTINRSPSDEPYVIRESDYKILMRTGDTMNAFMPHFQKFGFFDKVDVIFLITGLDMVLGEGETRMIGISGFAWCGGACTAYKFGESEDMPQSYDGTHLFAHELAHTLGCVHDEDPADMWVGPQHPGAANCPWSDGYIMSYVLNDTNHWKFSPCCIDQMRYLFSLPTRKCLHEINSKYKIQRTTMLPGVKVNHNKFCKIMHGWKYPKAHLDPYYPTTACKLQCVAPRPKRKLGDKIFTHYAIDGSSCKPKDSNYICINGKCLPRQQWLEYIKRVHDETPSK